MNAAGVGDYAPASRASEGAIVNCHIGARASLASPGVAIAFQTFLQNSRLQIPKSRVTVNNVVATNCVTE
jgi:hypothetical protein